MKILSIGIFALLLFVLFIGCQNTSTPLTEDEKEEIIKEVKKAFETSTSAVNEHDASRIAQFCWNDEDYLYAGNGTLIKGWERHNQICAEIHSTPKNQSFTIDYDEIIIKVLKRDAVMLVGKGYFHDILTEEGVKSDDLVITFLIEKINDKWVITIGHESSSEPILIF